MAKEEKMLFIDVQGTLLKDSDKSPFEGACELIELLNATQTPYVIITNNTKDLNFLASLRAKGLAIKEDAYIDPFLVLTRTLKPCKIAAFGSSEFKQALEELGFKLEFKEPEAVAEASWDEFEFSEFATMIELAKKGVRFVAMHETSIYKKGGRLYPGVGAIMAMIAYASELRYEVIGKPSRAFYEAALRLLQIYKPSAEFSQVTIISDDYKGDLLGARALGMKCALVLSGKLSDTKGLDTSILSATYKDIAGFLRAFKEGL